MKKFYFTMFAIAALFIIAAISVYLMQAKTTSKNPITTAISIVTEKGIILVSSEERFAETNNEAAGVAMDSISWGNIDVEKTREAGKKEGAWIGKATSKHSFRSVIPVVKGERTEFEICTVEIVNASLKQYAKIEVTKTSCHLQEVPENYSGQKLTAVQNKEGYFELATAEYRESYYEYKSLTSLACSQISIYNLKWYVDRTDVFGNELKSAFKKNTVFF